MKFLEFENLSKFLRWCLEITFVLGVFATVFLGFILKRFFPLYFIDQGVYYTGTSNGNYFLACMLILTPCGIAALVIIRQFISILKTVNAKNPFVYKNVNCIKRIAYCSLIISILFIILALTFPTLLTVVIGYIFLVAGFSCLVLCKLFQRAVEYKNENDLTI